MFIYSITNEVNGKTYVGQTTKPLDERWYNHLKSARGRSRLPIHCAIRKYGVDSFSIRVVSTALSREELDILETYFIDKYNSLTPNGYNRTSGGGGFSGSHTEAARSKMRESHLGKELPIEQRDKISEAATALWNTPEFRKKNTGRLGHPASLETRLKVSQSIKKHWELRKARQA